MVVKTFVIGHPRRIKDENDFIYFLFFCVKKKTIQGKTNWQKPTACSPSPLVLTSRMDESPCKSMGSMGAAPTIQGAKQEERGRVAAVA